MTGLFRNAFFSVAEVIWGGIVLFILFGYVAAHVGVAAIGAWSLVVSTISVSRIADIGVGRSLIRFVPAALARNRPDEAAKLIETALTAIAFVFLVIAVLGEPLFAFAVRASVNTGEEALALSILGYALLAYWLSNVASVFLSALASVHRYDQRSIVSMAGTAVQLAAAIVLVPRAGLIGLVWAQIVQNVVVFFGAFFLLRRQLPAIGILPFRFSRASFNEMLGFSASLQLMSIASFLFEPATKLLLSNIAGLTTVGYYELANRMVSQARTLLVSATQVATPALAGLNEKDSARASDVYLRTTQSTWVLTFPLMATIAAFSPAISELWLGHLSAEFVAFAWILSVAWTINLLCAPAFFMGLASGYIRWNLWGWVVISIANLVLGILFGLLWGGVGVVCASALALSLGSLIILVRNDRMFGRILRDVLDVSIARAAILPAIGAIATILVYDYVRASFGLGIGIAVALGIMAVASASALYRNPQAFYLVSALRTRMFALMQARQLDLP